jgi:hypothetical protein
MRSHRRLQASGRAGFTLVEVTISLGVFVLVALNIGLLTKAGKSAAESGVLMMRVDDELHLTVDRIGLALLAADASEVDGLTPAPLPSSSVRFQASLGTNGGEVVYGPVEEVAWLPTQEGMGSVWWRERPENEAERRVTWSKHVPLAYKAELPENFADDNENGLIDEGGLAFTMAAKKISIHVTVERKDEDGKLMSTQKKSVITCRN